MSCWWWLNTLFNKFWDISLMIGYNLERFVNSLANLERVTLYFDNLVDKNGTLSMFFHGIFLLHYEYMHVQVDAQWCIHKLKLVRPEKKIKGLWRTDAQECQPCLVESGGSPQEAQRFRYLNTVLLETNCQFWVSVTSHMSPYTVNIITVSMLL